MEPRHSDLRLYVCPVCGFAMREPQFNAPFQCGRGHEYTEMVETPDDGREADEPGTWMAR